MSIPLFYTTSHLTLQTQCILEAEESFHAIKVLRMKAGDEIDITNGMGARGRATIVQMTKHDCIVNVENLEVITPRPYHLHIAIAPTKNIDRYEWFLEKATELGIDEITPMQCEHSERRNVKDERGQRILISAMKQSEQAWLPVLHELTPFERLVKNAGDTNKYIGWCGTGLESHLANIYLPGTHALLLIGPEGDFSDKEVELALARGFVPVNLGPNRLRTETAGLAACSILNMMNDKK